MKLDESDICICIWFFFLGYLTVVLELGVIKIGFVCLEVYYTCTGGFDNCYANFNFTEPLKLFMFRSISVVNDYVNPIKCFLFAQ